MQQESDSENDSENDDDVDGLLSTRLRKERLESQGKYFRNIADTAASLDMSDLPSRSMTGHQVWM